MNEGSFPKEFYLDQGREEPTPEPLENMASETKPRILLMGMRRYCGQMFIPLYIMYYNINITIFKIYKLVTVYKITEYNFIWRHCVVGDYIPMLYASSK